MEKKIRKYKRIINKIYYLLFVENFNGKLKFDFPKDFNRVDLVDYLIKKNDYKEYLEIGCDDDQLFSRVNIKNKIGVDPVSGGNIRKTSDEFFLKNNKKFDIIFIDGLHTYSQVKKDILNSVNCLHRDGIILVHDCLPDNLGKQAIPRYEMHWSGDVWKAIVDLRQNKDLNIFTCELDQGIGIIKKEENTEVLKIEKSINKLKFKDYFKNYKSYLRVISLEEFKKKF
ncbi:class I SAM-dependent methyltransferase [Candidatus Pelagibacter communis]|uniref:class I SAM-dependent methyltransferase n=1 Tax=Pelagibacter ubique TaxID=198252 RepID=UPI00094DBD20|nr:class I SAM-dependent methyltransferase [Candidatus Pelagibacter ubique]|tara:strand:- start:911 stop:1591 length:681 start_codon:yes stop_codon:yes gene_type:complete